VKKHLSVLALSLVALLSLSQLANADTQCSMASLNTVFGFAGMGSIPTRVKDGTLRYDAVSHVGIATYDGLGKVNVSVRVQFQGKTSPFNFAGTYNVASDCTGGATFKDADGTVQLVWQFVLVHGGDSIETMALRPPLQTRPMYSLTFTQQKR
jgi:hypothetical protein